MSYTIKQAPDKSFQTKGDLLQFIRKNKEDLVNAKKLEYKETKGSFSTNLNYKGFTPNIGNIKTDYIQVKAVINTTNIIDSHMDLHMPKLWNKTVKDNPNTIHLQSHKADFENLLSSNAKQYNEEFKFSDLGLDSEMKTIANINEFVLHRKTNPLMFDRYVEGMVKEHSVGMRYVNIDLAYYDEDSQKEMDFFNEKKQYAVNPEVAEERGYFWVVSEAKKHEGSAVVFGSNSITPTLWVKDYEPNKSTQKEPLLITPEPLILDTLEVKNIINSLKF